MLVTARRRAAGVESASPQYAYETPLGAARPPTGPPTANCAASRNMGQTRWNNGTMSLSILKLLQVQDSATNCPIVIWRDFCVTPAIHFK